MKNKFLSNLLLLGSTLLLLALVGEVLLILRWDVIGGGLKRSKLPDWIASDPELMWVPKANVQYDYFQKYPDGSSYPVHYAAGPEGFRIWGDLKTSKKKIFVIGDSNTQALEVSNDKTYYQLMKQQLNAEFFVFGVNGYNSIQEWYALRRYLKIIQPDFVLWQFNSNDLTSNDCRHQAGLGFIHNPQQKLLCWDLAKSRVVLYPQSKFWLGLVQIKMKTPSRLLYWMATKILSLKIGKEFGHEKTPLIRMLHGRESTLVLFQKIKQELGNTPLYMFSNEETPFYKETLETIAKQNDFHFISGVIPQIENLQKQGENLYAPDQFHWNEKGHAVVADFLVHYLKSKAGL